MTTAEPLRILHLGLGSFHRAHQAVYLNRLIEAEAKAGQGPSWVLAGGNLRPDMAETIAALQAQGGAYTLETVNPAGERHYERIEAIRQIVPFEPSLAGLVELGARPDTRIISFTVTEAGYYLDSDNRLDARYPDLASDIAGRTCTTIYGALALILAARMSQDSGPVTLLNCDNLRSNGERFMLGFVDFLSQRGQTDLLRWVQAHTSAPNDMVDRITPRPLPDVVTRVKAATGVDDGAPVMAEAFIQWVIEDHFIHGRPAWETVGAQMVDSVLPFEEAKIRILNASHSCIAWAGTLLGLHYIHEGVVHPAIRAMAHAYVSEDVMPSLLATTDPYPLDLAAYRDQVLERFSNAELQDTNQRVAADGYAKIPGFLWPTLQDCFARGATPVATARLPVLFFELLSLWHRSVLPFIYQDQGMDEVAAHALFDATDPFDAFCRDAALWGPLAGTQALITTLRAARADVQTFLADNSAH